MNQRQKEILQAQLDSEKAVLKKLEKNYQDALDEINSKIELLMARQDADMQHVIYQVEYQKALKTQVQAILETLQANEFETVSEYLAQSYEDGFIGTMYDLQGQGIPLVFPIDQEQVVAAITQDTKLSEPLYESMGHDITTLKRKITSEISRGLSSGQMYSEISRNVASWAAIPKNNAMRIARTEGHRIQIQATANAQKKAKEKGADVVKQWDASLDSKTRDTHAKLDGQIRELDDPFEVNGKKAMHPGGFGRPEEDINCRCALLQRARWALGGEYTKWSEDAPVEIDDDGTTQFTIVEADNLKEFTKKYKQASERVREDAQKMNDKGTSQNEKDNKYFEAISELKEKGVVVDISGAGKYEVEAKESLVHLNDLMNEYNSTVVSFTVQNKQLAGAVTEAGSAYMMNGKTSISVIPKAFKQVKATDTLGLGENQPLGITYHEFAHALSQSREKIDKEFWKEIRTIKKDYDNQRNTSDWFNVKISDYASKDVDEFLAEAFAQAKLSDNPSSYSMQVLDVVDKYFGKQPLEKVGKSSTIKLQMNLFDKSDPLYLDAFSIEEEYGFEDICLHGSPSSVQKTIEGKLTNFTPTEFAEYLKENGYKGGNIRLASCSTGKGNDSFAQELSKILGVKIKAPDGDVYYAPDEGTLFVGSPNANTGSWRTFNNGVEEK